MSTMGVKLFLARGLVFAGLCAAVFAADACSFGINLDGLAGDAGADAIPSVAGASIAAGNDATCVVRQDGTVACWGDGAHLGNGAWTDSSTPVLVQGLNDAVQVCVGNRHACAVRKIGQVACWGGNDYGQLGDGSTDWSNTPVPAAGINDATMVSCENNTTCVAKQDGSVYCWGADGDGEVGNGTTADSIPIPVQVTGVSDATGVAAGDSHSCAVTQSGAVYCWGDGYYGENGDPNNNSNPTAQLVAGIDDAAAIGAGDAYTCALTTDGKVSCWGVSWSGRLGNPATDTTYVPSDTGQTNIASISVGAAHVCIVKTDATVACWGDNDVGQCGVGAHGGSLQVAVPVTGLSDIAAVAAGYGHSCSLSKSGAVECWGANTTAALGQGTMVLATAPHDVQGETSVAHVACGDDFTCDARSDGSVACWGGNDQIELGQTNVPVTATPTVVPGLSGIATIYSGPDSQTACAIDGSSAVTCWGRNGYGQLGNDNNGDPETPTPFGVAATDAVVGYEHVCVLATDGTVVCAGLDDNGQLGDGMTSGSNSTPTAALGVDGTTLLGGGGSQNCAVASAGFLCWGDDDSGQLGDGAPNDSSGTPVLATNFSFVPTDISAGSDFFCDIDPNGDVYCIGTGGSGQMGNGSLQGSHDPVKVLSLTQPAVQVAAGDDFACARFGDGTVSCWGDDGAGQLGNGQIQTFATAAPVQNLNDAVDICAGTGHACAVRSGGQLVCWGSNWAGQLGDGTNMIVDSPTPVQGF
jgi:alpha-tubulin suppressor-like RCC1 family protein